MRVGLAIALLVLMDAEGAAAQPASLPVSLTWSAPADCPSREQVLAEVARVLGGSRQPRISATARVDVARTDRGRWQAALSVDARDAHSERNLEAESCEAIASGAALIVAGAVDGGVPPLAPTASPPKAPAAPPAEGGESAPASQLLVTAAGVIDDGTMPPIAGGGEVALGWSYATPTWRVRALASASYFPPETVNLSSGEGGRFWLLTPSARACASIARGPFDLGPCIGAEIDLMMGSGVGAPTAGEPHKNSVGTGYWGSALGAILASWSLSRQIALFARADGLALLAQPTFVVSQAGGYLSVYSPPSPLAWRAALGVELRFF
jgi:hypothetical protein